MPAGHLRLRPSQRTGGPQAASAAVAPALPDVAARLVAMANDRSVGDDLRTVLAAIDRHRVGNARRVVAKVVGVRAR